MSRPSPLKAAAAAAGLNLREVAEATGYTHKTVGQVSRGTCAPWPEFRRRMTELFGFDPFDAPATNPGIAERVAASRAAQGLPPKVTDPATLARIAAVARPNSSGTR